MTLDELHNQPKYARVLASTFNPSSETVAVIGGEYKVCREHYDDNRIVLAVDGETYGYHFNRSDIQFLTPVEFKGKKIGIGDSVLRVEDWFTVYDYFWNDGSWTLAVLREGCDLNHSCYQLDSVEDHRPLTLKDPAKAKWEEEGRKNGWIT